LERQLAALECEKEDWAKEKDKIAQTHKFASTKVSLDVGGTKYATRLSTLTQGAAEHTMLGALFSGRHTLLEEDGSYFIDRDGRNFHVILNYFRAPYEFIPPADAAIVRSLEQDASFYSLPDDFSLKLLFDELVDSAMDGLQIRSSTLLAEHGFTEKKGHKIPHALTANGTWRNDQTFDIKLKNSSSQVMVGIIELGHGDDLAQFKAGSLEIDVEVFKARDPHDYYGHYGGRQAHGQADEFASVCAFAGVSDDAEEHTEVLAFPSNGQDAGRVPVHREEDGRQSAVRGHQSAPTKSTLVFDLAAHSKDDYSTGSIRIAIGIRVRQEAEQAQQHRHGGLHHLSMHHQLERQRQHQPTEYRLKGKVTVTSPSSFWRRARQPNSVASKKPNAVR
jgi:hypothetical protein